METINDISSQCTPNQHDSKIMFACVLYLDYKQIIFFFVFSKNKYFFLQLGNLEKKWQHHEQNNFVMKECILFSEFNFYHFSMAIIYCLNISNIEDISNVEIMSI